VLGTPIDLRSDPDLTPLGELRVEWVRAAGAVALALTVDWSFATRRDWGRSVHP